MTKPHPTRPYRSTGAIHTDPENDKYIEELRNIKKSGSISMSDPIPWKAKRSNNQKRVRVYTIPGVDQVICNDEWGHHKTKCWVCHHSPCICTPARNNKSEPIECIIIPPEEGYNHIEKIKKELREEAEWEQKSKKTPVYLYVGLFSMAIVAFMAAFGII